MKLTIISTALCVHIMSWTDNGYTTYALHQTKQPFPLGFWLSWQCTLPLVVKKNNMEILCYQKRVIFSN